MDRLFDLHLHSIFSDGKNTPEEIAAAAKQAGLFGFALTDHDTVTGLEAGEAAAEKYGLCFVPGIEVSAYGDCEIHILGLKIDYRNAEFLRELNDIKAARTLRNAEILKKLNALGMPLTEKEIEHQGAGSSGRAQIARAMAAKGYVNSVKEAFHGYLTEGGPAYCGNVKVDPARAIRLIHAGNGKAFLAHAGRLSLFDSDKFNLIDKLAALGLDGIEVYYPRHSAEFKEKLLLKAKEHSLLISGGTDNHGNDGDTPIGGIKLRQNVLIGLSRQRFSCF